MLLGPRGEMMIKTIKPCTTLKKCTLTGGDRQADKYP